VRNYGDFPRVLERILIAAAVALIGMVVLHLIEPSDPRAMDAFYAGCFLGMSTPERLRGWVQAVLGAILLTAMLVVVKTLLPDVGGELGFAAFVTVAVLLAPSRMTTWLTINDPTRVNPPAAATSGHPASGMPVRTMAGFLASLVLIGWLVLPGQIASEQRSVETEASAPVAEPAARLLEQVTMVQAKPDTMNEEIPSGTSSADAVNADLGLSLELDVTTTPAPDGHAGAANARAELAPASRADGAATATIEAAPRATPLDDVAKSQEALFREFIQWRAAHSGALAQPRPQPVKRSRNPVLQIMRLTPPASVRPAPRAPARTPGIRPVAGLSRP